MTVFGKRARSGMLAGVTALTVLGPLGVAQASAASSVTLRGDWAAFTRCPVDNPAMLAATGQAPDGSGSSALCVASDSSHGSIKLGNTTASTGNTNLQGGLVGNFSAGLSIVAPASGGIVAAPVTVPGGLLGLMCPSIVPVITAICQQIADSPLNKVTAVVQPAGQPSNFNLGAGLAKGQPILTLPVKIQLRNSILGSGCFIGTNGDPIVLKPENLVTPTLTAQRFDPNGTPDPSKGVLQDIVTTGKQGDSTFSVPGASGCGGLLAPVVDAALDLKQGLPSPAGSNRLVLSQAVTSIAAYVNSSRVYPHEGKDLSAAWHSAVLP